MQEEGWGIRRTLRALKDARGDDHAFAGHILGSMCTEPHEVAAAAHGLFMASNLGDPDHFPGAARLELEVLGDLAALLGTAGAPCGRFLTGGTEANLYALFLARERTGRRRVVVPEHAHFSFEKAARLLDMRLTVVPAADNHRADVDAMAAAIDRRTAAIVGVAGSTELGLVDDIPGLAAAADEEGIDCHVDAAFGGYVIPFLPDADRARLRFDFAVHGVTSVSLDPHKMGMATIPGGALFTRRSDAWKAVSVQTPYVSTAEQAQLLGTRPGAPVAAAWAVHRALGRAGFEQVVARCMENTRALIDGLTAAGRTPVALPDVNVVSFPADDPAQAHATLAAKGLRLNIVPKYSALRVVVNPHVSRADIDRLLDALEESA